jgi:hypothetical protein
MGKLCQASAASVAVGSGCVGLAGTKVRVASGDGGTLDGEGDAGGGEGEGGVDGAPPHDARNAHVMAVSAVERAE